MSSTAKPYIIVKTIAVPILKGIPKIHITIPAKTRGNALGIILISDNFIDLVSRNTQRDEIKIAKEIPNNKLDVMFKLVLSIR